uniref:vacuolar protein sorting-associated protein 54 n=1 Tax=Myxine glutinosa TaxID=7769 RepID=UPI00358EE300
MMLAEIGEYATLDLSHPHEDSAITLDESVFEFPTGYGFTLCCLLSMPSPFRHLGSQLCELERLIDKMMLAEIGEYAMADLSRPQEDGAITLDEERLACLVFGLLRQRRLDFLDIYEDKVVAAIRNTIKQVVLDAVAEAEEVDKTSNSKLTDRVRLLALSSWLNLLQLVFSSLLLLLQRVKASITVMQSVLEIALKRAHQTEEFHLMSSPREIDAITNDSEQRVDEAEGLAEACHGASQQEGVGMDEDQKAENETSHMSLVTAGLSVHTGEELHLTSSELARTAASLRGLLKAAGEACHDRCVKLLAARTKDGALERLTPPEFVSLSRIAESFLAESEKVTGGGGGGPLRAALQSQAARFLRRFHLERRHKLELLLDAERWRQADVPPEFQALVATMASEELSCPGLRSASSEQKPSDFLIVDGEKFAVVSTVLLLMRMLFEYCQCVKDIPALTPDILPRLIDLLKLFNSRCCQLVLGAGALQVVGLKTITTKNLALASRCLQLVLRQIPLLRAHLAARLHTKQHGLLRQFTHLTKDYNDHVAEIAAKLVVMMDSTYDKVLSKYEVKAPGPSSCFRTVCKQMGKMHEALWELLPPTQVQDLFHNMNDAFKQHLRARLSELAIANDGGPQHGLVTSDLAFYAGSLRALKGLDSLPLNTPEVWDLKR